jgi:hypothetical protein
MDQGAERITDDEVLRAVRAQAKKVYLKSAVAAVVVAGLAMLLPAR